MPIYKTLVDLISEKSLTDKCIVLDIDNTLLFTTEDNNWISKLNVYRNPKLLAIRSRIYNIELFDVVTPTGKGDQIKMSGILRNDAREFMAFCFHYFRVVTIWSAGKKKYVHKMAEILCQDLGHQPNLIFSYQQCQIENKMTSQGLVSELYKPLRSMYVVPGLEDLMNERNTLALDDRASTFGKNPENGVLIPEFFPEFTIASLTKNDNALRQFMVWLMLPEVKNSTDVRLLDKSHIFKLKLTEHIEPVLIQNVSEPINIDTVELIDYDDTEVTQILNDKNYNTKRTPQKNGYFGLKFLVD